MEESGQLRSPVASHLGKSVQVPTEEEAGWAHSRFGHCGEEKNLLILCIWEGVTSKDMHVEGGTEENSVDLADIKYET
jgi:hypothetical protein